jgi:hypothetical protein
MAVAADGALDPRDDVWGFMPSAQVVMGRSRTNFFPGGDPTKVRRPPSWAQLRAKARRDYLHSQLVGSARLWAAYYEEEYREADA